MKNRSIAYYSNNLNLKKVQIIKFKLGQTNTQIKMLIIFNKDCNFHLNYFLVLLKKNQKRKTKVWNFQADGVVMMRWHRILKEWVPSEKTVIQRAVVITVEVNCLPRFGDIGLQNVAGCLLYFSQTYHEHILLHCYVLRVGSLYLFFFCLAYDFPGTFPWLL